MDPIAQAERLAERLQAQNFRVVFAESCTAGLVAATLARVPGISSYLCGSAVTYREQTKQAWLDVSGIDLAEFTAESEQVTRQMATGVLRKTPEAEFSAAVTGHLGPGAPEELDGVIFIAIAQRQGETINKQVTLEATERVARQHEAAAHVLAQMRDSLDRI